MSQRRHPRPLTKPGGCRPAPGHKPQHPGVGLLSPADWQGVARRLGLSVREVSVARLIFEGQMRAQLARQLGCAPGTVRVYIDRLFTKLNVKDRLAMALAVVRAQREVAAAEAGKSHKNATCTCVPGN